MMSFVNEFFWQWELDWYLASCLIFFRKWFFRDLLGRQSSGWVCLPSPPPKSRGGKLWVGGWRCSRDLESPRIALVLGQKFPLCITSSCVVAQDIDFCCFSSIRKSISFWSMHFVVALGCSCSLWVHSLPASWVWPWVCWRFWGTFGLGARVGVCLDVWPWRNCWKGWNDDRTWKD